MNFFKKNESIFLFSLLIALFVAIYYPVFSWLIASWETNPFYSHGYLIPVISGSLLLIAGNRNKSLITHGGNTWGLIILFLGLVTYGAGVLFSAPVISGLSLVVTLYGIVIQVMGMEFSKKCIFPVVFLVFMIPVPHIDLIATGLAAFSGQVAASMADVLMIPAISNGAEIYLPDASLVVGVPCSGMSTIIGLYIPTSLLIYLLDCPLLKKIIFWCMILPVAILSNIVRIFLLIVAFNWGGMNLALDFFHTLYGYLLPLIAFLFLVFIIMACRCFNLRSDIL